MKNARYAIALIAVLVFIVLMITNDVTVANWQGKVGGLLGRAPSVEAVKPYDASSPAAAQVCGEIASQASRTIASVQVLPGLRPTAAEEGIVNITDTFVCSFTSGETIPFMITYVGGEIVNIQ